MPPRLIRPAAGRQLLELPFRSAPSLRMSFQPVCATQQLHTTHQPVDHEALPESFTQPAQQSRRPRTPSDPLASKQCPPRTSVERATVHSPRYDLSRTPARPESTSASAASAQQPLELTPSLRDNLPRLTSQPPFYATIHIHGKPYLVTAGDAIRLPFLMHGVLPGDVLRLDRASRLGSRDWTLVAGTGSSAASAIPATAAPPIVGKTDGLPSDTLFTASSDQQEAKVGVRASPKRRGGPAYLDDRLFVVRAVVTGTESEPMRIKEKTKRRQRHVKHVKSKHRFTMLRIREITIKGLEELEAEESSVEAAEAITLPVGP